MLQSIRNLFKNWIVITLFGVLVAVAFLFFGIEGYFSQSNETWVAKVDGQEIPQQEYTSALNNYRQQQLTQPGNTMEPADFQKPEVKQRVLRQVVNRQLLLNANDKLGITIPNSAVAQQISSFSVFQTNGKFDPSVYLGWLASQQRSAPQFEAQIRGDLATRALPDAISTTAFATAAEVDAFLHLQLQQRDFSYVDLPAPSPTAAQSTVSDAEITAYYQQHQAEFMRPEQVSVNYIDLDAASMSAQPDLSDAALQARYEKEKTRFSSPPEWQVSHILVSLPAKPTAAEKQAALAKAVQVEKLARAPGADFAKLAEQYSDDLGSKRQGGDLGWLRSGDAGPELQAALDKLKQGEISAPVESSDGYHILDVRAVRAGHTEAFTQVREQLLQEAKDNARQDAYRDIGGQLTDMIYKDPSSLKPIAQKLGLTLQTTPLFGRAGAATGIAANPQVVKAAYSDTVLAQGNTSDPIELGENHMLVLHIDKHVAAAVKPLQEVSELVRQDIIRQRVDATAKQQADAAFAKLQSGTDLDALAKAAGQPVKQQKDALRNAASVNPEVLKSVFKLAHPAKDASTPALVALGAGQYALVVLHAVKPGDLSTLPAEAKTMLRAQMAAAFGSTGTEGFVDALRKTSKIQTAPERL